MNNRFQLQGCTNPCSLKRLQFHLWSYTQHTLHPKLRQQHCSNQAAQSFCPFPVLTKVLHTLEGSTQGDVRYISTKPRGNIRPSKTHEIWHYPMLATGKQNTDELRSYSIRVCGRAKLNTVSPGISVPITNSRPHRWISRELWAFSYNTHLLIKTVQTNECRQGRPFSTALTIQVTSGTDANADSQ